MLATSGGPVLGGFITTNFSWRWIFYINIPVGGAALVYLMATLHVPAKKVSHKIDYLGGSLLAIAAPKPRPAEPMLPLHVFRNENFSVTMGLTFLTGLAMFGALTFLPLYQ